MDTTELVRKAREAAQNSYSPYSRFRVGAVAVDPDGGVHTGANIENASFPATSCGEANAMSAAVSSGARKIDAVVVACVDAEDVEGAYPCGRCRQIMAEFDVRRIVVTAGEGSEVREHSLDDLLPHHFSL